MPIEVRMISRAMFCELLGLDPKKLVGVRDDKLRMKGEIALLLEQDDADNRHSAATQ